MGGCSPIQSNRIKSGYFVSAVSNITIEPSRPILERGGAAGREASRIRVSTGAWRGSLRDGSQCGNRSYTLTGCTTRHYMQTTIGSDYG